MTVTNPNTIGPLIDALGQLNIQQNPGAQQSNENATAPTETTRDSKQKDDDEDMDDVEEEDITYKVYTPAKLGYGCEHPDRVVENATLAAVSPPEITYNLAMPADIIAKGKLSNLQLEAIVYGSQRHLIDLPTRASPAVTTTTTASTTELESNDTATPAPVILPERSGFLLGDMAGMGKGRTLARFVVENISRGVKKHVWISVSNDLYEDAKRDLRDLGLEKYSANNCYNLKEFKSTESIDVEDGVMFCTYSTLIAKNRFDQLLEWCRRDGVKYDGLLCLDECHKCKTIELDGDGKPKKGSSQTATKVVELQAALPRARVVYCSATSVSEPTNLGFMNRLGLWGSGTEHVSFNEWLDTIAELGTGSIELNAMHLKALGATQARQLSYSACNFAIVDVEADEEYAKIYEESTKIWSSLYAVSGIFHVVDCFSGVSISHYIPSQLFHLFISFRNWHVFPI